MDREQVLFRLFGKYCPEGTILYTEGSLGEELYVVGSGAVRLGPVRRDQGGSVTLGAGEVLGEEAFFSRAPRPRRAEIVRDSRLFQISDRNLEAFVRHGGDAALALLDRLVEHARQASHDTEAWSLARSMRRAEAVLLRSGEADLSPEQLADGTGLAAADAGRLLEELERIGVAERRGGAFRIAPPALLGRAARTLEEAGEGA